jgi:hypothetical protein
VVIRSSKQVAHQADHQGLRPQRQLVDDRLQARAAST